MSPFYFLNPARPSILLAVSARLALAFTQKIIKALSVPLLSCFTYSLYLHNVHLIFVSVSFLSFVWLRFLLIPQSF